MKHEITLSNIYNYISGNANMILDRAGMVSQAFKEQIAFRHFKCKDDCVKAGKCKHCGCKLPGRFFTTKSCNNGERFPDIMEDDKWEQYKKDNGIE